MARDEPQSGVPETAWRCKRRRLRAAPATYLDRYPRSARAQTHGRHRFPQSQGRHAPPTCQRAPMSASAPIERSIPSGRGQGQCACSYALRRRSRCCAWRREAHGCPRSRPLVRPELTYGDERHRGLPGGRRAGAQKPAYAPPPTSRQGLIGCVPLRCPHKARG